MGRQIQIRATNEDEIEFLAFLRTTAEIAIFSSFAPKIDELWVESFSTQRTGHWCYHIWNREFAWTPSYKQTTEQKLYYVANSSNAPVIEFQRDNPKRHGRIYWSKYFSAHSGLNYDVASFERWYNAIIRWTRKRARRYPTGPYGVYHLPGAWAEHERREAAES